ncbi:MAG: PIN domain nuclease [Mycolicibacter algericus]|uniref:Ribonuclease VapC n=1 Tax=Mycobacterium novum TaxID=2492438 RepID=A0A7I7JIM3_9MYCO|nr:ribonuclease VapC51 [Mycobacterium novum]
MGLAAHFLGDTSAVARVTKPAVAQRLIPLIEAGLVARCTVTDLEAGISARNGRDWKHTRHVRSPWPQATIDQDVMDRAFEVQGALAVDGLHRTVKLGDLLIAAAAERAGLVVLHYDRDFDRIATITGQPTEWVAPPGTAD